MMMIIIIIIVNFMKQVVPLRLRSLFIFLFSFIYLLNLKWVYNACDSWFKLTIYISVSFNTRVFSVLTAP